MNHILSWIVFLPLIGMGIVLLLPRHKIGAIRWTSAFFTFLSLLISVILLIKFDSSNKGFQFVEHLSWIPSFNVEYFIGVDGLSIPMVFLTTLLSFLCIFASWSIKKGEKAYFALFLLLETGMLGVFVALDFFLFYVFWELMLLPMYFLIGVWGGPRREYAAIKFFLYTLFGSVLMLIVMLVLYFNSDVDPSPEGIKHTFDITLLTIQSTHLPWLRGDTVRLILYVMLYIGFAIKVPVFPFHTWLPDAHVEAPTPISVILAGVLLKMGTYGILRISYSIFPDVAVNTAYWLAVLGVFNIVYGALVAMAQQDFKKLIAYSSISHMGYVLLGMASFTEQGMNGAVLQMFNHGTITGMLFLVVGVIYDRAHHRDINGFGGLATGMPRYAGITSLAFFASMGLPGLSGFISEVLVFLGAYRAFPELVYFGATGIIITAAYLLWTFQRIFLGGLNEKYRDLPDVNFREIFTLAPLGVIVVLIGVYPSVALNFMKETLNIFVKMAEIFPYKGF